MDRNIPIVADIRKREQFKIDLTLDELKEGYRSSIVLVGHKGSGKTTMLNSIPLRNKGYKYININSGLISNPNQFTDVICSSIKYHPPKMEDWKLYADTVFNYIHTSNSKYVFLIDDVHYLAQMKKDILSYVRNKYQELNNILFIMTLDKEYIDDILAYDKPFYGQLHSIELDSISEQECHTLIESISSINSPELTDFICRYGDGTPLYIKLFIECFSYIFLNKVCSSNYKMDEVCNMKNKKGIINFDEFYKNVFFSYQHEYISELKDRLDAIIGSQLSPQLKAILKLMANNSNISNAEISKKLYTSSGAISTQMKRLADKGLVRKYKGTYIVKQYVRLLFDDAIFY